QRIYLSFTLPINFSLFLAGCFLLLKLLLYFLLLAGHSLLGCCISLFYFQLFISFCIYNMGFSIFIYHIVIAIRPFGAWPNGINYTRTRTLVLTYTLVCRCISRVATVCFCG